MRLIATSLLLISDLMSGGGGSPAMREAAEADESICTRLAFSVGDDDDGDDEDGDDDDDDVAVS